MPGQSSATPLCAHADVCPEKSDKECLKPLRFMDCQNGDQSRSEAQGSLCNGQPAVPIHQDVGFAGVRGTAWACLHQDVVKCLRLCCPSRILHAVPWQPSACSWHALHTALACCRIFQRMVGHESSSFKAVLNCHAKVILPKWSNRAT